MGGLIAKPLPSTSELKEFALQFSLNDQAIDQLYSIFQNIDLDGSGEVDQLEFYEFIQEVTSPFVENLSCLIGVPQGTPYNFYDFVRIVSIFCCFDDFELLKFAFDTFDKSASGSLEHEELEDLLVKLDKTGYINDDALSSAAKALLVLDKNGGISSIDFDEFCDLNKRFPNLLWPVFRLQHRMGFKTLGIPFWERHCKRVFNLTQKSVSDILAQKRAIRTKKKNEGKNNLDDEYKNITMINY